MEPTTTVNNRSARSVRSGNNLFDNKLTTRLQKFESERGLVGNSDKKSYSDLVDDVMYLENQMSDVLDKIKKLESTVSINSLNKL